MALLGAAPHRSRMPPIVRQLKTKLVLSAAGLALFFDDFPPDAVRAIIDLVELGTEHPNFGTDDNPGAYEYSLADQATDALLLLFEEEYAVDDFPQDPPRVTINFREATIAIHNRWYVPPSRRKGYRAPVPDLRRAVDRVSVRLLRKPDAKN